MSVLFAGWMVVTAYCLPGTMASGQRVHPGAVATHRQFPFGASVQAETFSGTVLDRGRLAPNQLDRWVPSCWYAWNVVGRHYEWAVVYQWEEPST